MDNGTESVDRIVQQWSLANGITFKYIFAGKPTQNTHIERFNKTYRGYILDAYLFDALDEVREVTFDFVEDYNNYNPH